MMRLLVIVVMIALAGAALATDSRLGLPDQPRPEFDFEANVLPVAEVLICLDTDANAGFADLTPRYAAAFAAASAAYLASLAAPLAAARATVNSSKLASPFIHRRLTSINVRLSISLAPNRRTACSAHRHANSCNIIVASTIDKTRRQRPTTLSLSRTTSPQISTSQHTGPGA